MNAAPGHGKWRLKGRGGTLLCHRGRPFFKAYHGYFKQCRICGFRWTTPDGRPGVEIGVIERVRFIDDMR